MKVLLINGSIHERGCTYTALSIMKEALEENGIEGEIAWIGDGPIDDYNGKPHDDDIVKEIGEKCKDIDGLVVGTPVWYSHPAGRLLCLMDRLSIEYGRYLAFKPACSIASARRAGQVISNDVLNKHFSINNMPIVTSTYWNLVFASTPEEVYKDEEGVCTMKNLANNMAWMIKSFKKANLELPTPIRRKTNFHR